MFFFFSLVQFTSVCVLGFRVHTLNVVIYFFAEALLSGWYGGRRGGSNRGRERGKELREGVIWFRNDSGVWSPYDLVLVTYEWCRFFTR